jgi:hypothetical protein
MTCRLLILAAASAAFASPCAAITAKVLSLEAARKMVAAAEAEAQRNH